MKHIIQFLIASVMISVSAGEELVTSWGNVMPWAKKAVNEADFQKNVELRFIKKDWLPQGMVKPTNQGLLKRYPGKVADAYDILRNAPLYEFHSRPLSTALELLTSQFGYDPTQPSVILIHTISGDAENYFIQNTVAALGMRNFPKNYNVFALNMPGLQASMEQTIIKSIFGLETNYRALGEVIGQFLTTAIAKNLMDPDRIHLIGFCYSSQLSGYVARYVTKHTAGKKIKSILGLDPYSIGFHSLRNQMLTKDDAQIVHAIHTNSYVYGSMYRRATADFIINTGMTQPGCYFTTGYMCSHRRAVLILWYLILYGGELFQARSCSSYTLFCVNWCKNNQVVGMSYPLDERAKGRYYITTSSHRPYGYGAKSSVCFGKNSDDKFVKGKNDIDFTTSNTF